MVREFQIDTDEKFDISVANWRWRLVHPDTSPRLTALHVPSMHSHPTGERDAFAAVLFRGPEIVRNKEG